MSEMKCKRCGADENRIHGFCSVECENYYSLESRIAELEKENAMLKQLSQPIEFWSDEKMQIYKSNESRSVKSGNEERDE